MSPHQTRHCSNSRLMAHSALTSGSVDLGPAASLDPRHRNCISQKTTAAPLQTTSRCSLRLTLAPTVSQSAIHTQLSSARKGHPFRQKSSRAQLSETRVVLLPPSSSPPVTHRRLYHEEVWIEIEVVGLVLLSFNILSACFTLEDAGWWTNGWSKALAAVHAEQLNLSQSDLESTWWPYEGLVLGE